MGLLTWWAVPLHSESPVTVVVPLADDQLPSNTGGEQLEDSEIDESCCLEVKRVKVVHSIHQVSEETVRFSFMLQNRNKGKTTNTTVLVLVI
jgi:hypothetical protein